MRIHDIQILLDGEQGLSERILKAIPLIEKHFKAFDGKRALIASGGHSAPFNKVCKAFREELHQLMPFKEYGFNAYIDASYSSAWVKFKYCMLNGKGGCSYHEHGSYIADLTGDGRETFDYKYEPYSDGGTADMCKNILAVSKKDIETTKAEIEGLNAKIKRLESVLPYQFKDALKS